MEGFNNDRSLNSQMATDEQRGWREKAAACDNGQGLVLEEYDPDDKDEMSFVFEALQENNLYAQGRLKRFIRNLRFESNQ